MHIPIYIAPIGIISPFINGPMTPECKKCHISFFLKKLNPIQAPTGQGWQKEQDQSDVSNALQEGTKNFKTENR